MLSQFFGVCRKYSNITACGNASFELMKPRETSNKALNAINQISLVTFLMSFLVSRDKLPLSTVTSAGT